MKMNWVPRSMLAVLAVGGLMFAGCESDGDSVEAILGTGPLVVRGNVISFTEGDAPAAVAGGKVYLEGTDVDATLGADGKFTFDGIPAGTYTAVFEMGDISGSMEIIVKDGYTLELRSVTVYEDGTVQAQVIYHALRSEEPTPTGTLVYTP